MATCALGSARARDGALFSNRWNAAQYAEPPSEAFYTAARDAIPKDLVQAKTFDYLRTCALLAVIGIQYGQIDVMHQYMGFFHTFVTMRELYDENNWDRGLGIVGIEERRRVVGDSFYELISSSSILTVLNSLVLVDVHPGSLLFHCLGWPYSLSRSAFESSLSHRNRRRVLQRRRLRYGRGCSFYSFKPAFTTRPAWETCRLTSRMEFHYRSLPYLGICHGPVPDPPSGRPSQYYFHGRALRGEGSARNFGNG